MPTETELEIMRRIRELKLRNDSLLADRGITAIDKEIDANDEEINRLAVSLAEMRANQFPVRCEGCDA